MTPLSSLNVKMSAKAGCASALSATAAMPTQSFRRFMQLLRSFVRQPGCSLNDIRVDPKLQRELIDSLLNQRLTAILASSSEVFQCSLNIKRGRFQGSEALVTGSGAHPRAAFRPIAGPRFGRYSRMRKSLAW